MGRRRAPDHTATRPGGEGSGYDAGAGTARSGTCHGSGRDRVAGPSTSRAGKSHARGSVPGPARDGALSHPGGGTKSGRPGCRAVRRLRSVWRDGAVSSRGGGADTRQGRHDARRGTRSGEVSRSGIEQGVSLAPADRSCRSLDSPKSVLLQLVLERILVTNPWGQPTFLRLFSSSTLSDTSKWRCAMLNWQSRGLLLGAKWA